MVREPLQPLGPTIGDIVPSAATWTISLLFTKLSSVRHSLFLNETLLCARFWRSTSHIVAVDCHQLSPGHAEHLRIWDQPSILVCWGKGGFKRIQVQKLRSCLAQGSVFVTSGGSTPTLRQITSATDTVFILSLIRHVCIKAKSKEGEKTKFSYKVIIYSLYAPAWPPLHLVCLECVEHRQKPVVAENSR